MPSIHTILDTLSSIRHTLSMRTRCRLHTMQTDRRTFRTQAMDTRSRPSLVSNPCTMPHPISTTLRPTPSTRRALILVPSFPV